MLSVLIRITSQSSPSFHLITSSRVCWYFCLSFRDTEPHQSPERLSFLEDEIDCVLKNLNLMMRVYATSRKFQGNHDFLSALEPTSIVQLFSYKVDSRLYWAMSVILEIRFKRRYPASVP
jgi:hypothetical protein